jgi:hypothetical protein
MQIAHLGRCGHGTPAITYCKLTHSVEDVIGTRKTPRRHFAHKRNLAAYTYSAHPCVLFFVI